MLTYDNRPKKGGCLPLKLDLPYFDPYKNFARIWALTSPRKEKPLEAK